MKKTQKSTVSKPLKIVSIILLTVFVLVMSGSAYLNSGTPLRSYFLKENKDLEFLNEMILVKEYNFDGGTIGENGWVSYGKKQRRGGWWSTDTIKIENGFATFNAKYHSNGINGTYLVKGGSPVESPAGFYAGAIKSTELFKYGYFEARIKMPKLMGSWGAFWLTTHDLSSPDGKKGMEIDVAESSQFELNILRNALHYNYPKLQSRVKFNYMPNLYSDFYTFGLLWTQDSYTFYINGNQYYKSSFGGVSQVEQFLVLSVEPANNAPKSNTKQTNMIVDYVRVYDFAQHQ